MTMMIVRTSHWLLAFVAMVVKTSDSSPSPALPPSSSLSSVSSDYKVTSTLNTTYKVQSPRLESDPVSLQLARQLDDKDDDELATISVSIPQIQVTLHIDLDTNNDYGNYDSNGGNGNSIPVFWSRDNNDLEIFATATASYIDNNYLLERSLGLSGGSSASSAMQFAGSTEDTEESVELVYEGVEFSARRGLRQWDDQDDQSGGGRRLRSLRGGRGFMDRGIRGQTEHLQFQIQHQPPERTLQEISTTRTTTLSALLTGSVQFTAPQSINPLDLLQAGLPTEDELYQLILEIFDYGQLPMYETPFETSGTVIGGNRGENLFLETLKNVAEREGGSEWMGLVRSFEVRGVAGLDGMDGNEEARVAEEATVGAGGSNSIRDQTDSSSSNNSNNNSTIFIIVGVVGAALSLTLIIGGLCYAKRKHDSKNKKHNKSNANATNNTNNTSINDSISSSKKKKKSIKSTSILRKSKHTNTNQQSQLNSIQLSPKDDGGTSDDDESNAEFLMARAALQNKHSSPLRPGMNSGGSVVSGFSGVSGVDDNMSYAFSVEGESIANQTKTTMDYMDGAIGAGGMSSFINERGGVFQWNEEGTKMVYTPAVGDNGGADGTDGEGKKQNGFVYDEKRKKWVIASDIEKNVSFQKQQNGGNGGTNGSSSLPSPLQLQRNRTDDTTGDYSAVTGTTDFSYDDVALDFARRTRSGESSLTGMGAGGVGGLVGMGMDATPSSNAVDTPKTPMSTISNMMSPMTNDEDEEEGVEVVKADEEFFSNTNIERFLMQDDTDNDDNDSSVLFDSHNVFQGRDLSSPVQQQQLRVVTPDPMPRVSENPSFDASTTFAQFTPQKNSIDDINDINGGSSRNNFEQNSYHPQSLMTSHTSQPSSPDIPDRFGAVKNARNVRNARSGSTKSQDAPFDEDVPFDELSNTQTTNKKPPSRNDSRTSTGGMSAKSSKSVFSTKSTMSSNKSIASAISTGSGIKIPSVMDMDDESESEASADSSQVLEDLNHLSRFMKERKRSNKSNKRLSGSVRSGSLSSSLGSNRRSSHHANAVNGVNAGGRRSMKSTGVFSEPSTGW